MPHNLILISTIAGLATTCGASLVLLVGNPSQRLLSVLLAAAAGIMLALVCFDLLPAALQDGAYTIVAFGVLAGIVFMRLCDRLLVRGQARQPSAAHRQLRYLGYLIASSIALHDIPEGIAIAVGHEAGQHLGFVIACGITLHNLPEGMAIATPLLMAGLRKRSILLLTTALAFCTPLGACLGSFITGLGGALPFCLSFAAGTMACLVLAELMPLALKKKLGGRYV